MFNDREIRKVNHMNNRGFTLIETIVAMTVFLVAVTSILYIYSNGYVSYIKNNNKIEAQENLRIALNKISRNIRQAERVTSVTGTQITIEPVEGNNICGYRYDSNNKEVEVNAGGTYLPIASNIVYLNFDYDSNNKVVTITVRGQKDNSDVIEMNTKVQLRTDPV